MTSSVQSLVAEAGLYSVFHTPGPVVFADTTHFQLVQYINTDSIASRRSQGAITFEGKTNEPKLMSLRNENISDITL